MPDKQGLSETLRELLVASDRDVHKSRVTAADSVLESWLMDNAHEILQALDDSEQLTRALSDERAVVAILTAANASSKSTQEWMDLESDNERYRATIAQLEKERAEAAELAELVRMLKGELHQAERYRSERGSF